MSGPDALSIAAGVIADVGLKSTALFALGAAGSAALRGASAAQRHAAWAGAFAALPLLAAAAVQRGPAIAVELPGPGAWLAPLWLLGVLVSGAPLLRGLLALRRLRRGARPHPELPGVLLSPALSTPVTWGLLRPVIALPSAAAAWPEAQRAAALAHERAHVRRRDWAVHLGAWAACALLWFHPLAWWARRALAQEAEHAADDAALAAGARPSDYAQLLLSLRDGARPRAALGAAAAPLARRVRAVLDPRPRGPRRRGAFGLALLLAGAAAAALGPWPAWTRPPDTLTCSPGPGP